ncbi:MAG: hypothetical protein JNL82_40725 [Myxococcales bacterium]|nr:hypothetical protein [Myxococcales bacterium]
MLVVGGVMLTVSANDPAAVTPVALIVPVAVVLVLSGVYMWILREHLVAHRFHWLMLRILLVLVAACLVGRVSGALVGHDSTGVILLGLVGAGSAAVTVAVFVAPVLWGIGAVQLAAAALVATHVGSITVIDVLAQTATVLVYTRAWRASTGDTARMALTRGPGPAAPRPATSPGP